MRRLLNLRHEHSRDPRRRGDTSPLDLGLGIGLLIGLPLLTYLTIRGLGLRKTKSTAGQFREKVEVEVEPDAALLQTKYEYFEKVYVETGREFLDRARQAQGVLRMRERDWAKGCFRSLITEIDTALNELDGNARFGSEITRLTQLRSRIKDDLAEAEALF